MAIVPAAGRKKSRSIPLFWQITAWVAAVLFVLLGLTLALTLQDALDTFQLQVDDIHRSTVATLTESPAVRESVRTGQCDPALVDYLDSVVRHTTDLDFITIADKNARIVYHVDHSLIGQTFQGDGHLRALAGEFYLTDTQSNLGIEQRAFGPVTDASGQVLGFVMAGAPQDMLLELRKEVYTTYLQLFAFLMTCSLVLTGLLVVYLKGHLRGVRSEDLLRSVLTQNDILNNLEEGLVSLDDKGRIRLVNQAAAQALGLREELLLGRPVDEVLRTDRDESLRDRTGQGLPSSRTNILVDAIRIPGSNPWARQVLILKDKSEAIRQAEQLNGTRHIISALRANNHEFLNKLQVISGLLQMGYTREAQDYIGDISATHVRTVGPVMQLIDNSNVAALILGKMGNMRELDIDLTLLGNSRLPEHSRYLSTDELVTVVGNLLENAIEAVDATPRDASRSIVLQITEDDKGLLIMVSDSGVGIEPEDLPHLYTFGFSTKAPRGRGVGMALVKQIVDRCGGDINVDTETGSGTTIAVFLNKERRERV